MSLEVRLFISDDTSQWDIFCTKSLQGTLLHTRKFLSYHQNRFDDRSLVIFDESGWLGVLPAALNPTDPCEIVSHPGITYGGILHLGQLRGERMIQALHLGKKFYSNLGYKSLIYKVTPSFYHRSPAQDDLYALFRLGASRIRCDLSSTIDLENRLPLIKGRRWGIKKAQKAGLTIVTGSSYLKFLWEILTENLAAQHCTTPTHSLSEIQVLTERFADEILCICAEHDGNVVAGVVLFITPQALHTQYIAANAAGREMSATDGIIEYCINLGVKARKKWFDFGINNESGGVILNDGLYTYKNGFGGGGYVHEFYKLIF